MALREPSLRAKRKHSAVSGVDANRKLEPHGGPAIAPRYGGSQVGWSPNSSVQVLP